MSPLQLLTLMTLGWSLCAAKAHSQSLTSAQDTLRQGANATVDAGRVTVALSPDTVRAESTSVDSFWPETQALGSFLPSRILANGLEFAVNKRVETPPTSGQYTFQDLNIYLGEMTWTPDANYQITGLQVTVTGTSARSGLSWVNSEASWGSESFSTPLSLTPGVTQPFHVTSTFNVAPFMHSGSQALSLNNLDVAFQLQAAYSAYCQVASNDGAFCENYVVNTGAAWLKLDSVRVVAQVSPVPEASVLPLWLAGCLTAAWARRRHLAAPGAMPALRSA